MKTYLFILPGIALVLSGNLSAQQTNRLPRSRTNYFVLPNTIVPPVRPRAVSPKVSSALIYPVNPPRSTDGRPMETGSTNFVFMYPVNPPRVVKMPAQLSIVPPDNQAVPK